MTRPAPARRGGHTSTLFCRRPGKLLAAILAMAMGLLVLLQHDKAVSHKCPFYSMLPYVFQYHHDGKPGLSVCGIRLDDDFRAIEMATPTRCSLSFDVAVVSDVNTATKIGLELSGNQRIISIVSAENASLEMDGRTLLRIGQDKHFVLTSSGLVFELRGGDYHRHEAGLCLQVHFAQEALSRLTLTYSSRCSASVR